MGIMVVGRGALPIVTGKVMPKIQGNSTKFVDTGAARGGLREMCEIRDRDLAIEIAISTVNIPGTRAARGCW